MPAFDYAKANLHERLREMQQRYAKLQRECDELSERSKSLESQLRAMRSQMDELQQDAETVLVWTVFRSGDNAQFMAIDIDDVLEYATTKLLEMKQDDTFHLNVWRERVTRAAYDAAPDFED